MPPPEGNTAPLPPGPVLCPWLLGVAQGESPGQHRREHRGVPAAPEWHRWGNVRTSLETAVRAAGPGAAAGSPARCLPASVPSAVPVPQRGVRGGLDGGICGGGKAVAPSLGWRGGTEPAAPRRWLMANENHCPPLLRKGHGPFCPSHSGPVCLAVQVPGGKLLPRAAPEPGLWVPLSWSLEIHLPGGPAAQRLLRPGSPLPDCTHPSSPKSLTLSGAVPEDS